MNRQLSSWSSLTLMVFCFLYLLWSVAGMLAVVAFSAVAELCCRALDARQRRMDAEPDREA